MTAASSSNKGDLLQAARAPLQAGRYADARDMIDTHLRSHPEDARAWGLLGLCLRHVGDFDGAESALQRALRLEPGFASALQELGFLRRDQGREVDAIDCLQACLQTHPANSAVRWELARLLGPGDPVQALGVLLPLLVAQPGAFELRVLEAQLLAGSGDHAAAWLRFEPLLTTHPESVPVLEGSFWALLGLNLETTRRIGLARALVELAPTGPRWMNLAHELQAAGDFAGGRAAVDAALRHDPAFLPARWAQFQLPSAPAPLSSAAAARFCNDWDAGLAWFEEVDFDDPTQRSHVLGCIGQSTAFYRHYLGDEVRLQCRYGRLVHRMMAMFDPGETHRPLRPGRRRIGICSAHLREHTVARLFVPLIEALDPERFDLFVFSLDDAHDRWSQRLRAIAHFENRPADTRLWAERLRATDLDILLYPEVGMHPKVQTLAALRLAPIQAVLWGHPVTTGMSSIDLFLSADALEPDAADAHYSETLIRLPGLGHGLREADLPTPVAPDLGPSPAGAIDLLCAQTVYKLLPEQDSIFGRILAALPEARLHLLADHRPAVRDWLRARMSPTLRSAGADPERQLLIHGFVDHAHYLGLPQCVRLNLDSIGWSGGMSALDLLAQGLPTLTLPGASMRSQQTASLLHRLGLPELVASDPDDYVEKALALASDPARCRSLSAELRTRRRCLFADPSTSDAFNTLLAGVERDTDGTVRVPLLR